MSHTIIERIRVLHSDLESIENIIIQLILHPITDNNNNTANNTNNSNNNNNTNTNNTISTNNNISAASAILIQQQHHAIQSQLSLYLSKESQLRSLYADLDGSRAAELRAIQSNNSLIQFKQLIEQINTHYNNSNNNNTIASTSNNSSIDISSTINYLLSNNPTAPSFTMEESNGLYVDLHHYHELFLNLPCFSQYRPGNNNNQRGIDYLKYLSLFSSIVNTVDYSTKLTATIGNNNNNLNLYSTYLTELFNYLLSFHQRINPLVNHPEINKLIREDFQLRWNKKLIKGWINNGTNNNNNNNTIIIESSTPDNPLFCIYCEKSFAKDTVFKAHLTGKKHLKAAGISNNNDNNNNSNNTADIQSNPIAYELALKEELIHQYSLLLSKQIESTIQFIELKQTRTAEELEADRLLLLNQQNINQLNDSNSTTMDTDNNTTNYPLDRDGIPIPYWLYRQYGLNQRYDCEICGDNRYYGPKAYQQHFNEPRHINGLKCLGIELTPSTRQYFNQITSITAARSLWNKYQLTNSELNWNSDDSECEDSMGNVYKKKTFIELQRQGLV